MDDGEDIALGKPAIQSSVSPWSRGDPAQDARRANGGAITPDYAFHTDRQANPWWQVDLQDTFIVERIALLNRFNYAERLRHFSLLTSLDGFEWQLIYRKTDDRILANPDDLPLVVNGAALARFIRVRLDGDDMLHFREFRAFGRRPAVEGQATPPGAAAQPAAHTPFREVPIDEYRERSWIREFCHRHSLDERRLRTFWMHQTLRIRAVAGQEFHGNIEIIRIAGAYGRFGNVFYQLLSAFIIARRTGCRQLQLPDIFWGGPPDLPMRIEEIAVMPWPELAGAAPTLMGSLFIPTGLEPLFADFGAEFSADTVQRYVLPLYRQLLTGIEPLGRNVIAMHFRAGDIITPPAGASIHGWYVQPPAAYYLAAFEHAQQHFGVDSVCLVFEDHANPAIDCVARALASRGVPCRLQSADVITDLKTLLGASHLVPSYGTFCEAIAVLSAHCETYYGFRRLSSAHDAEGFPQARVDQLLRVQGVRTLLIDDVHDRYTPAQQWTASREQLELITTFPQEFLELKEIPRG